MALEVKSHETIYIIILVILVDLGLESLSESVGRVENTTFTINLFSSDAQLPFPPISSSTWTRDGQAISDANIELTNYNITFRNVLRSQAGTYKQTASNILSNGTAIFSLDVLCKLAC